MINALDRGLQVLEYLSDCREEMGVREMAREMDLNEATLFRILKTLEGHQLVIQNHETKKYQLGIGVLRLARGCADRIDVARLATPVLQRLCREVGESVFLLLHQGNYGLYVAQFESSRALRVNAEIGRRVLLYVGAASKAILAWVPAPLQQEILVHNYREAGLSMDYPKIRQELETIRSQGYAVSREEIDPGVLAVGAPVFDVQGRVIAAVGITMPLHLVDPPHVDQVIRRMLDSAGEISRKMGYRE